MKPTVICLTPVKNEAWILDKFLAATSLWADHIIIADQGSTDGSREIAQKFGKVILIDNPDKKYNEVNRQKLLLSEARKIKGNRLLIALDVDEFFTSNFRESKDWNNIINSKPGSVFGFRWFNIKPGFKQAWSPEYHLPFAKIDDGLEHKGKTIHSARIPINDNQQIQKINDFQVMHLQYVDWERMKSKHRYYQCLETVMYPEKNPVDIFRMYHHMYNLPKNKLVGINSDWFKEYEKNNIDIRNMVFSKSHWFDDEVIELIKKFGEKKFRRLNIWETKWYNNKPNTIKNPQSILNKLITNYLIFTQIIMERRVIKYLDRVIKYKVYK